MLTRLEPVIVVAAIFPPVTAPLTIALVSTASLASSLEPIASAAICVAVNELELIFAPAISPSATVILEKPIEPDYNLALVTAPSTIAFVSTASSANSAAPIALVAICVAVSVLSATCAAVIVLRTRLDAVTVVPAIFAPVTAESTIAPVSTASSANLAAVTALVAN